MINELEKIMRKICLNNKDGNNVVVYDETDEPLEEYCNSLSKLLTYNNVSILTTSSSVVIIRPSQIQSIQVEDVDPKEQNTTPDVKKKQNKIVQDIITDK